MDTTATDNARTITDLSPRFIGTSMIKPLPHRTEITILIGVIDKIRFIKGLRFGIPNLPFRRNNHVDIQSIDFGQIIHIGVTGICTTHLARFVQNGVGVFNLFRKLSKIIVAVDHITADDQAMLVIGDELGIVAGVGALTAFNACTVRIGCIHGINVITLELLKDVFDLLFEILFVLQLLSCRDKRAMLRFGTVNCFDFGKQLVNALINIF